MSILTIIIGVAIWLIIGIFVTMIFEVTSYIYGDTNMLTKLEILLYCALWPVTLLTVIIFLPREWIKLRKKN